MPDPEASMDRSPVTAPTRAEIPGPLHDALRWTVWTAAPVLAVHGALAPPATRTGLGADLGEFVGAVAAVVLGALALAVLASRTRAALRSRGAPFALLDVFTGCSPGLLYVASRVSVGAAMAVVPGRGLDEGTATGIAAIVAVLGALLALAVRAHARSLAEACVTPPAPRVALALVALAFVAGGLALGLAGARGRIVRDPRTVVAVEVPESRSGACTDGGVVEGPLQIAAAPAGFGDATLYFYTSGHCGSMSDTWTCALHVGPGVSADALASAPATLPSDATFVGYLQGGLCPSQVRFHADGLVAISASQSVLLRGARGWLVPSHGRAKVSLAALPALLAALGALAIALRARRRASALEGLHEGALAADRTVSVPALQLVGAARAAEHIPPGPVVVRVHHAEVASVPYRQGAVEVIEVVCAGTLAAQKEAARLRAVAANPAAVLLALSGPLASLGPLVVHALAR